MLTIAPESLCSRCGIAASTRRMVPRMSMLKACCHDCSPGAVASALTLAMAMSSPPKARAASSTQAFRAAPSPTSSARPNTLMPRPASAWLVASTSAALRAQKATWQPSAASVSTIARPMPLVPPVTTARLLASPRSMCFLRRGGVAAAARHSMSDDHSARPGSRRTQPSDRVAGRAALADRPASRLTPQPSPDPARAEMPETPDARTPCAAAS
jgi:hypothetical protein